MSSYDICDDAIDRENLGLLGDGWLHDHPEDAPQIWRSPSDMDLEQPRNRSHPAGAVCEIMEYCCEQHPEISIENGIFGGVPHIREMRLSVGDVLAQIYMLGSIQAVVERYRPDITEEQVKEAIAYAQDFLEAACNSY